MYELLIIGASAAGSTAGIYAARRRLNFKIISEDIGGEVATSGEIQNWPGITETTGIELANMFKRHLEFYNVNVEDGVVVKKVVRRSGSFELICQRGDQEYIEEALAVLIASGVKPRKLNIPGEKKFSHMGLSYCTTCDGPLFQGKTTATIGGGNSALESALMLSQIARRTYLISKNPELKGDPVLMEKVKNSENIEVVYNADTQQILGNGTVASLRYKDITSGETKELKVEGVFVHIGMIPNSDFLPGDLQKNKFGEIIVNKSYQTNIPGLFAAGDVTDTPYKQIVIAAGQGAAALLKAVEYLNKLKK